MFNTLMKADRVSVKYGKTPVIIVSPHIQRGHLDVVAESAADFLDAHFVINHGFKRAPSVDLTKDEADCFRIDHCLHPVVREEFLEPIIRIKKNIKKTDHLGTVDKCLIYYLANCGNLRSSTGERVEAVVGYGAGRSPYDDQFTCSLWRRNMFLRLWRKAGTFNLGDIYVGKRGKRFAGRNPNNLNQWFREHDYDNFVQSMTLGFNAELLKSPQDAKLIGLNIAVATEEMLKNPSRDQPILKSI